MGGWVRIPLFFGAAFIFFIWNGGSSLFRKRKGKGNIYGITQDEDDITSPNKESYFGKSAYNLSSANKYGKRLSKENTLDDLKDVGAELERLHKL